MARKLWLLVAALMFTITTLAAETRYVLGVDGLSCPFCAYGIEKRLSKLDGVIGVEVDVGESVVRVTVEEGKTLSEAQARRAVNEAGFTLRFYSEAEGDT